MHPKIPVIRGLLALCLAAACGGKVGPASRLDAGAAVDAGGALPIPPGYDASYSAGPFTVQPGTQLVMCTYLTAQNTQDVDVQSFYVEQSVGGHHLIIYTVDHPINLPPTPCVQGGQPGWNQVFGTQDEFQQATFPSGVGFHLQANQQLVMETHYINATPNVLTARSGFGVQYSPAGSVTQQASPYFMGTQNINIPPNASWSATTTCRPPGMLTLYTVQGHEHQMGTGVTVALAPDGGSEQQLYQTEQWSAPPTLALNNGTGMLIGPSDQVTVTCNWDNTGSTNLSYPFEMCYAVGFVWPGDGPMDCVTGGGGDDCQCTFVPPLNVGSGGSTVQVNVGLQDGVTGVMGDPASSGHPIYCALYLATDWPATAESPNPGAQPYYFGYTLGVALTDSSVLAPVMFNDVTPGDYSAWCFEDTLSGGEIPGSGEPINYPLGSVTAVAGTTAIVDVYFDVALP